jgi:hypothetical protein
VAGKKKRDSLQAEVTVDPSAIQTDRTEVEPAQPALVELLKADKRLDLKIVARSTITMLAFVEDEGPFHASVSLKIDGNFVTFAVDKGMNSVDMIETIQAVLPEGYEVASRESSASEVLIVTILRPPVKGARSEPEVSFLSTDPAQSFRWVAKNKLRIEGRASMGLSVRSIVDVFVEGYRVKLPLGRGDFPLTTANRLRDALPESFVAMIELPMVPGGDVTLTILRRR